MHYPESSIPQLVEQAPSTIDHYIYRGIKTIDRDFGEGYAKTNPQLLAAYITACASDFNNAALLKTFGSGLDELVGIARRLADRFGDE